MKSRQRVLLLLALLLIVQLPLDAQSKGAVLPAEVTKTVNSFLGHWTLTGTDSERDSKKAVHVTVVLDCESAALGMAVSCRMASDAPGSDHVEMASLIGYSPDEGVVRLMEVSSSGSNHVHTGPWQGNVIRFARLSYSEAGQKRIETFAIGFPSAGKMTVKSVTETAEGTSILDLEGTRR